MRPLTIWSMASFVFNLEILSVANKKDMFTTHFNQVKKKIMMESSLKKLNLMIDSP